MDPAKQPTDDRFDAAGTVIVDRTCRRCGYNVRGLNRDGRCPECGMAVELSLQGDLLRFANPDWVAKLARGSAFITKGLTAVLVTSIILGVCAGVAGASRTTSRWSRLLDTLGPLSLLVAVLGAIAAYLGVWIITSPDPTKGGEKRYAGSRKLARVTLLIGVANLIVQVAAKVVAFPAFSSIVITTLAVFASLGLLVGWLGYLSYLGKLANRIPDDALAERGKFLFRAFLITPLVTMFLMFTGLFTTDSWGDCFAIVLLIVFLALTLTAVRLQHDIGLALREQATIARATWAAPASEAAC